MSNSFSHITTWVFDMDDTLYPASLGMKEAIKAAFGKFMTVEYGITPEKFQELSDYYTGQGLVDPMAEIKKEVAFNNAKWAEFACGELPYNIMPNCQITADLLDKLAGEKVVFTNGSEKHTQTVLSQLGLDKHFSHISHATMRNMRLKPEPEIYKELQNELGTDPQNMVMVDDHPKCLLPAKELGWTTVLVYSPVPANAPWVDHIYPDLLSFLQAAAA